MFKKRTKQTLGKKKEKSHNIHKTIVAAEEQKTETFTDAIVSVSAHDGDR